MNLIDYKKKYIKYKKKYILLKGGDGTKIFINNFKEPKLNHICNKIHFNKNFNPGSYYIFHTKNLNLKPITELEKYVKDFMYLCNEALPKFEEKEMTKISSYKFLLKLNDKYNLDLYSLINQEYKTLLQKLNAKFLGKNITISPENLEIILEFYIKKKFIDIDETRNQLEKYLDEYPISKDIDVEVPNRFYGYLNYYHYKFKNYLENPEVPEYIETEISSDKEFKFKYVEEIPDGNCFFFVIVRHLYGNSLVLDGTNKGALIKGSLYDKATKLLRIDIGLFLMKNYKLMLSFGIDLNYIVNIINDSWADDNTNYILVYLLKKNIFVYSSQIDYDNFKLIHPFTESMVFFTLVHEGISLSEIEDITQFYEKSKSSKNIFAYNHKDNYGIQVSNKLEEIILNENFSINPDDKKYTLIKNLNQIIDIIRLFLFKLNEFLITNNTISDDIYEKSYQEARQNMTELFKNESFDDIDINSLLVDTLFYYESNKYNLGNIKNIKEVVVAQTNLIDNFLFNIYLFFEEFIYNKIDKEKLEEFKQIINNYKPKYYDDEYYMEKIVFILLFPPRGGHFSSLIPI